MDMFVLSHTQWIYCLYYFVNTLQYLHLILYFWPMDRYKTPVHLCCSYNAIAMVNIGSNTVVDRWFLTGNRKPTVSDSATQFTDINLSFSSCGLWFVSTFKR